MFCEFTPSHIHDLLHEMHQTLKEIHHMSTTAVTRDQLDAKIDSLETSTTNGLNTVLAAVADLVAKVAAGSVSTPEDFSAEAAKLDAIASSVVGAVATVSAADPQTPPATT